MKITTWGLIKAYVFGGGKTGVIDYILGVLNDFLKQDNIASKVEDGSALAKKVLSYLEKYASFCPSKWLTEYHLTIDAVKIVVDAFADKKVTQEEINGAVEAFTVAYKAWMAEDAS